MTSPKWHNLPWAHFRSFDNTPHLLSLHLTKVAERAAKFAEAFDSADIAYLMGLWHDLGKCSPEFQERIRRENGVECASTREAQTFAARWPKNHTSAGALYALGQEHLRHAHEALKVSIALGIIGHHGGLPDREKWDERKKASEEILDHLHPHKHLSDFVLAPERASTVKLPAYISTLVNRITASSDDQEMYDRLCRRVEMWRRFLFSALCDADFLDTEAFYSPGRAKARGGHDSIDVLATRLQEFMRAKEAKAEATNVNLARSKILGACRDRASSSPGAFSLTVPTGGGKTLAGLTFALEHARMHGMRRVIVAIPYTSIIDQTAQVYKDALGPENVIEHHSAFEPAKDDEYRSASWQLACENWDAPVVVTTTVQLFESLFSHRPSSCRKLHNIAKSVIILDEAQTLPINMLQPILDGLRTLIDCFGCSVVVSTATQPVLDEKMHHGIGLPKINLGIGLSNIRELAPDAVQLFDAHKRVRVEWMGSPDEVVPYQTIAHMAATHDSALVIVHLRDDARNVCELMDKELGHEETMHLSALMHSAHRKQVLNVIKSKQRASDPIRVVSTQLVEAGVDIDFPVVFRAMAGMDSLAQAAGRCNREGKLGVLGGELYVFRAETTPPSGVLATALAVTASMRRGDLGLDLFTPKTYKRFFRLLYGSRGNAKEREVQESRQNQNFESTTGLFKIIEDEWSAPIVVPTTPAIRRLIESLAETKPTRRTFRALQQYSVNVRREKDLEAWLAFGAARQAHESIVYLTPDAVERAYSTRFGLLRDKVIK